MGIRLTNLQIRVVAGKERFGADLPFKSGLNIIRADNTAGKSTCVNSIVWALGLDGMLGPQHRVPLPHAMTSEINGPDGTIHTVTESYVTLEIQRSDGTCLTIRRQVAGPGNDKLVSTWNGPVLSDTDFYYRQRDYYVRRAGAAKNERGFHKFLMDWCGWEMPNVSRFDGTTVPLYIEAVAPLWIVEQKGGWSGLQALTPTYLRISDVKKRAVEYVLALDVLGRRSRIQELRQALDNLQKEWHNRVAAFNAIAQQAGAIAPAVPQQPTGDWPPTPEPSLLISNDGEWVPISNALRETSDEIAGLQVTSLTPQAVRENSSSELDRAEKELRVTMAASTQMRRSIALDQESVEQARRHLAVIEKDKRRHKDLLILRKLGSRDDSLLRTESCPVCNRDLGDVLLDEDSRDRVMGVEETITHLDAQADLAKTIINSSLASLEAREAQSNALTRRSRELRSKIFALRTALTGGGPTIAKAEALITARHRLERFRDAEEAFGELCEDLSELSDRWRIIKSDLRELMSSELSGRDRHTLTTLEHKFQEQLANYGFASLSPKSMRISQDTYQPDHEGYNPTFESSASDLIRIIWAYLLSILCVSDDLGLNHPGLLIFDEPRQQMAAELSFRELIRQAVTVGGQVVFATSEPRRSLMGMVKGFDPHIIDYDGKVLQPL